ncbi:MAG: hypothetical protein O7F76_03045, partial [Planctomycetota bacterium]|nr:hypothetical protein [Planctomycetota bacterium]
MCRTFTKRPEHHGNTVFSCNLAQLGAIRAIDPGAVRGERLERGKSSSGGQAAGEFGASGFG